MKRATLLFFFLVTACNQTVPPPSPPPGVVVQAITVTSKSFATNGPIPVDYSCDGKEVSPQVTWSSPPDGTKSLAVIVDDPDAPNGLFTHWIVFDLPPDQTQLAEGVDPSSLGAKVGVNDFGNARYGGPCPPKGQTHRYRFRVIALNAPLGVAEGANRAAVDTAMNQHVLGEGTLYGLFSH